MYPVQAAFADGDEQENPKRAKERNLIPQSGASRAESPDKSSHTFARPKQDPSTSWEQEGGQSPFSVSLSYLDF